MTFCRRIASGQTRSKLLQILAILRQAVDSHTADQAENVVKKGDDRPGYEPVECAPWEGELPDNPLRLCGDAGSEFRHEGRNLAGGEAIMEGVAGDEIDIGGGGYPAARFGLTVSNTSG